MDTLEREAKQNYKKAQEAGLSGALREFADEIDNKKEQKFDKVWKKCQRQSYR